MFFLQKGMGYGLLKTYGLWYAQKVLGTAVVGLFRGGVKIVGRLFARSCELPYKEKT